jgi:dGTPase
VARSWAVVTARYPDIEPPRLVPELVRDQIGRMVNDVLEETINRVDGAGVESVDDVRRAGRALAGFSAPMEVEERRLKLFLSERMYGSPPVKAVAEQAQGLLSRLFAAYAQDPSMLPREWRIEGADRQLMLRRIGDFIAGMTDRYAIARHRALVGPVELPEGF